MTYQVTDISELHTTLKGSGYFVLIRYNNGETRMLFWQSSGYYVFERVSNVFIPDQIDILVTGGQL